MATEVLMPQMGESIAEGEITRWLVAIGTRVERDQPLLEISTDKVDAEIPSPAAGVLLEIRHHEGEVVPVNEVVGLIGEPGEETAETTGGTAGATAVAADGEPAEQPSAEAAEERGETSFEDRVRRYSSPLVRSIAKQEGVDISRLEGSGIHGRVTKKDILAYLDRRERGEVETPAPATEAPAPPAPTAAPAPPTVAAPAATPAPAAAPAPAPSTRAGAALFGYQPPPAYGAGERVRIEPMSKKRRLTAGHMVYSKATSAHVSTVFHVDMTRVDRLRRRAREKFQRDVGTKLTYMPFIFRAVCAALREFPQLNAAIDGTDVVYKDEINLGMAVAIDRGLIVPVIKNADERSLVGLARAANDLAERARGKKLQYEEQVGGTFTITNPGVFGSLFGTPVINQPQVAILGIGAIEKRPVVLTDPDGNDSLAIRVMSYFAITFDHRLIDGADADHFMIAVRDALQDGDWDELDPYL